jgi:hypothetical protein
LKKTRHIIPYLFTIVILLYPGNGLCSYLIRLKNGAEILTNQYWEKDGQIRFNYHGGIVGFNRTAVLEIIDSALPVPVTEPRREEPKTPPVPEPVSVEKKEAPLPTGPEKEVFLEKKTRLTSEIKSAMETFKTAKHQKDKKNIRNSRKKILSLKTELSNLEKEVKKQHAGQVPDWWNTEKAPADTE